jgi:membrane-bound lytic murein transglycosylase B
MLRLFIVTLALVVAVVAAAGSAAAEPSFAAWLEALKSEAARRGVPRSTVDRGLAGVSPIPSIIDLDRRQPEFTETLWRYLDSRVNDQRIGRGRALTERHRDLLAAVQRRFGVQPRFLVAFWGLETDYGRQTGGFPVFSALATLAYDSRRSDFFREQLLAALELAGRGDIAAGARSSWAGAMGQVQFMPTTYRDFAIDFDGDGRADLWNSLPDIFASAANYLASSGWHGDETWGREVQVPPGFDVAESGLERSRSLDEWSRLGLRRGDGRPLPAAHVDASLLLPGGLDGGLALLLYPNFHTIMEWNRSLHYAITVGYLADRIAGGGSFRAKRPAVEVAMSREDVVELQERLARMGFHSGEADGRVGARTREAIRGYQQQVRLPADGFPSPVVLAHLRRSAR